VQYSFDKQRKMKDGATDTQIGVETLFFIVATGRINAGEEILCNYGLEYNIAAEGRAARKRIAAAAGNDDTVASQKRKKSGSAAAQRSSATDDDDEITTTYILSKYNDFVLEYSGPSSDWANTKRAQ
jgi:hypothetical protein